MRHRRLPFIAGFLVAPVVLYLVYVIWPYIQTFGYSFTDWNGFSPDVPYAGVGNYTDLFKDEVFLRALFHNAVILTVYPIITIAIALFFAFMLNVGGNGRTAGVTGVWGSAFYKIVFFFPQVLSIAIVAIIWSRVFESSTDTGLLNSLLLKLGVIDHDHPKLFLGETDSWPFKALHIGDDITLDSPVVLWCLIAVAVWGGVGFYLVLFSAGMQSIPRDIYEAALLDGSSRVQSFFKVTLPLLREQISVAWVYLGIAALDFFLLAFALPSVGVQANHASEVMSTWMYYTAFSAGRVDKFGYACAMGIALAVFTLLFTMIQLRLTRSRDKIEF
ncbi:sugar ABC transporter permease [Catellatospora sp. TT07R-123]|uniref:carbohydrate ABC transporter permease n=1 Tax=Catellatospora sp. TT07R-123 TaxID=2733863 RepID=UPI001B2F22A5|nr:sugar ABC transporter permease [Catellatospora sp. TT07R-123]GHJ46283.1 sugar ABC transporter permease [Catellatospora sp. TT07R-123]